MSSKIAAFIGLMLVQNGTAWAGEIEAIIGEWRTVRHGADIRIEDCGDGTPCGFLVSVGANVHGGETHDVRNRTPELRMRPLQNLPILWGYQPEKTGWRRGKLYNPETGQTFKSGMVILSPDQLKVKGCLGPFCREQIWTRIQHTKTMSTAGGTDEQS